MLTYTFTDPTVPKYIFLYRKIKQDILLGNLTPGEKLPSKRTFAAHLGVSVITIDNAYQLLIDEGYAESRERSGYYVHHYETMRTPSDAKASASSKDTVRTDSQQNLNAPAAVPANAEDVILPLQSSDISTFPLSEYQKIMRKVLSGHPEALTERSPVFGCENFRKAIAKYLADYRGIYVKPEQIIIGSGSEQLYSCLLMFFGRDKIFGLEDPSYEKIRQVYEANGGMCEMLPMDKTGINSDALASAKANILHVTPFHSFPTGITANAGKRMEYLRWAAARDGYIIEDDIDSEFAVGSKPVETVFSMDTQDRVIYMNTFTKSIAPSLRVGYLVLPESMLEDYTDKLGFHSCTVPTFDQYVLAEFIRQGYFERHLNRLRRRLRNEALPHGRSRSKTSL